MANQPIPVAQANEMIQNYLDYMTSLNVDGQTESVSFNSTTLLNWMDSVKDYADEFRIFFGAYSNGASKEGRITTIIWPYKDDEPATRPALRGNGGGEENGNSEGGGDFFIDPFNEGDLRP